MPRIGEKMQTLQGFHYTMTLDLNMGYYIIDISPESHYLTIIIIEFGKLRYNRVPMGLYAYSDIFQAKVDNLLIDIEGVKSCIDTILVLGKWIFFQHIYQLIVFFARLHATRLKVDYPN